MVRYYIHLGNHEEVAKYYRQPFLTKTEWVNPPKKAAEEGGKKKEKKE